VFSFQTIMKFKVVFVFSCAAMLFTQAAVAAEIGDPAPQLQIAEWVKGKPVDLATLRGKKFAVVEFWGTLCPPCLETIPRLTALQKKYKDVAIVGISSEDVATVKQFVARMGDKMDYSVAADKDAATARDYLLGFNEGIGIPKSFVVDKAGRVVWTGFSPDDLESVLADVVAGTFNVTTEKKRRVAQAKLDEFFGRIAVADDDAAIQKAAGELEALDKEVGGIVRGTPFVATNVVRAIGFQKAREAYQLGFMRHQDEAGLDLIAAKLRATAGAGFDLAAFTEPLGVKRDVNDYIRIVIGLDGTNRLASITKNLADMKPQYAAQLLNFTWNLLASDQVKIRDLALATKLAKSAVDGTEGKSPMALDVYARALFDSGKKADAVATEKNAIALAIDANVRAELEATLKQYEAATK
jgi:thiol-disulfide isomerase/thioredoxin